MTFFQSQVYWARWGYACLKNKRADPCIFLAFHKLTNQKIPGTAHVRMKKNQRVIALSLSQSEKTNETIFEKLCFEFAKLFVTITQDLYLFIIIFIYFCISKFFISVCA